MSAASSSWQGSYWKVRQGARHNRRRVLVLTAASTGAAAFLAACGSSKKASSNTGAPVLANQGQPRLGGTVTVTQPIDPFDWDVTYLGKNLGNIQGITHACSTLIGFKSGPNVKFTDLVLEPRLAERWETPDGQTFSFHLRKGVKFANLPPVNGREFTSADVKWSYEYEARAGQFKNTKLAAAQNAWMFEGIQQIETPDPYTAVVRFEKPFVPFLNYIGYNWNPLLAHEIYDQDGNFKNRIVGTDAWQLDTAASQKGSRWVWTKSSTYWDTSKPYINQIIWLVIPDDATARAAFQSKQLDVLTGGGINLTPTDMQQLKREKPDAIIDEYIQPNPVHFYMMVSKPPLNDLRVRQAISYGIDRNEFVQSITSGKGDWALAGADPSTFTTQEIHQMLKTDPSRSKQLLSAAGYANGLDLEFIYPGNAFGNIFLQEMQLFQAQMKRVGINLVLKNVDKADWLSLKKKHAYTTTFTNKALAPDVDSYLYAVFYPGSEPNYGDVNDSQLTLLLDKQRQEPDLAKRKEIVRQAVKRINVDQVWALALFSPVAYDVWQPRLKNYATNFGTQGWPLEQSWLAS